MQIEEISLFEVGFAHIGEESTSDRGDRGRVGLIREVIGVADCTGEVRYCIS